MFLSFEDWALKCSPWPQHRDVSWLRMGLSGMTTQDSKGDRWPGSNSDLCCILVLHLCLPHHFSFITVYQWRKKKIEQCDVDWMIIAFYNAAHIDISFEGINKTWKILILRFDNLRVVHCVQWCVLLLLLPTFICRYLQMFRLTWGLFQWQGIVSRQQASLPAAGGYRWSSLSGAASKLSTTAHFSLRVCSPFLCQSDLCRSPLLDLLRRQQGRSVTGWCQGGSSRHTSGDHCSSEIANQFSLHSREW